MKLMAANAAKDVSMILGIPFDPSIEWVGLYMKNIPFTDAVMSDEVRPVPFEIIPNLCGMPDLRKVPDPDGFCRMFNACLREIVLYERSRGSRSDICTTRIPSEQDVLLFDGYAYYGTPQSLRVRCINPNTDRHWRDLLQGLAATVCSKIFPKWGMMQWTYTFLLSKEQSDIVEAVSEGRAPEIDDGPEEPDVFSESCEIHDCSDEYPLNAQIISESEGVDWSWPDKSLFADLKRYRNSRPSHDVPFVPSCMDYADFKRMDEVQTMFYLSWRDRIVRGIYEDSDMGYLHLILSDLLESTTDCDKVLRILHGMYNAYGESSRRVRRLLEQTCNDYAMLTGQDPPCPAAGRDRDMILSYKLCMEPMGRVSLRMVGTIGVTNIDTYIAGGTEYDDVLHKVLSAADGYCMKHLGGSLYDTYRDGKLNDCRPVLSDVLSQWKRYLDFRYADVSSSRLGKVLVAAGRIALIAVNSSKGLRCPRMPSNLDKGLREAMTDAAKAAVSGIRAENERREAERRMADITLDPDAVAGAESDLDTVRDLMSVEDDAMPDEEPLQVPEAPRSRGGWPDLAAGLDDSQKGYLRACLEGSPDGYLREHRLLGPAVEDSINSVAMDIVGDQIVESGTVFDEYAEDVGSIL